MKETVIVRNSGDDFISVTTNEDAVKNRITKFGILPYMKQADYDQFRLPNNCFRLIQDGLMVKAPKSSAKK